MMRKFQIIASLRQLCDKLEQDQSNEKTESVSQTVSGSVYTPNAPLPQRETINNDGSQESFETTNEINKSKDEEEDEWEVVNETLLYADCVGAVESELIEPGKSVLLVDLDTENPLIQVKFLIPLRQLARLVMLYMFFAFAVDWPGNISRHLC